MQMEGVVTDLQLGEKIRQGLKVQRDTNRFCDVVFHVHNIEFLAHRCVLAACSPYFDSVLDLNRCGKEHLTISADWKTFSELLDFIYTGYIYINENNVAELIRLSGYFLMSGLKDYCGEFLERSMCVKNCLGIKALSEKCGLLSLAINSTGYIQEHINELAGELELLELTKAKFEAFLKHPAFSIENELKLVMVSRWVMHKLSKREENFKTLVTLVPLQQIDHLKAIEIVQVENLYHASQHCLYHILHELYSFGVHLGALEITYSDLCRKVMEQPTLEGNVLEMAVNSALGDMVKEIQDNQGSDENCTDATSATSSQIMEGSVIQVSQRSFKETLVPNQDSFLQVVLPKDDPNADEGNKSEPKIIDHLSYTKAEDTDIVKEHVFEETDAVGQVHLKQRFQGIKNEDPSTAVESSPETVKKAEENVAAYEDDDENLFIAESVKKDTKTKEPTVPPTLTSVTDFYEAETDEYEDAADYDDDNDDDYDDDIEKAAAKEVPKACRVKVKTEPKVVDSVGNRRKRKGRPRKTPKGQTEVEDSGNDEGGDEEWKVETPKRKAYSRGRKSTLSAPADKKKNLVMKITVKKKKDAKKQPIPPKKTKVKVKPEYNCEECTFTSRSIHRFKAHSRFAHKTNGTQSCNQCDFKSKWNKEYVKHMKEHFTGPPFNCDEEDCSYVADKFALLLHHRRRHSDERPFECDDCNMKFRTRNNLTSHLRCHSGEKPFQCPDCQKCFATRSTLNQHSVTHSNHRPYLCDTCGFSTKYQSHLIAHKRIHTGDVYRCAHPGCKYFTPKRSQLNAHMRTHLSIRSHICSQCGRGFVEKSHLVRHEKLHSNEKGFKCTECDYASYRRDKLKLHIEKHHSPGSSSTNSYRPRKQRVQKVTNHPSVFHQGMMASANYGFPTSQYPSVPGGHQMDTKPIVEEQMYVGTHLDPMNAREQYPTYHRAPTPPMGNTGSPDGLMPNSSGATTTLTNVRQPRVAGYIVQPMTEQNQGVYTPQGDIGGLGAFMALF